MKKVWPSPFQRTRKPEDFLKRSFPLGPVIAVNKDDKEAEKFLALNIKNKISYSLDDAVGVKSDENGSSFQTGKIVIHSKLPGIFNVSNMLGAIALAKFLELSDESIKKGIEGMDFIRGRMEKVECGQNFDVVVDYAHTPDSLRAVYETYAPRLTESEPRESGSSQKRKYHLICILGNTGGGRDTWKRKEMGKIADEYCDQIILTNEDPYDEDPRNIVEQIKTGITKKPVEVIMDRREAIRKAISEAHTLHQAQGASDKSNLAVLITGKGTDPYIMGPNGTKEEWDDAKVAREELGKMID
jgi:UDP-N-acetylmuramoyl-L-alanyl-D-glutamate--2,6-diaminopimelate ligase